MMLQTSRRQLLAGFGAAVATSGLARVPARASARGLDFLAMGDWGRDGASHQLDVAAAMGRRASQVHSRLVVTVGDNFYDNGVQSATDPQWRSSFEDIYTAPSLQTPWLATLGNHDYRGVPEAQIAYSAHSRRWKLPSRYYTVRGAAFGAPHVDFFMLDTSPLVNKYRLEVGSQIRRNVLTQDVAAQLAWLDHALAASRAPWKLAFGHHPIFSGGSSHGNTPEMIAQVEPILKRHGVQAYVAGHDHDMQFIERDGLHLIQAGAGSEVRPVTAVEGTRFCLSRSGFAHLRSDPEVLGLAFIDYQGVKVFDARIARWANRSRHAA